MIGMLDIEVSFDLVCPWCLIGKRYLERALISVRNSYPEVTIRIVWRGVQLLPDVPAKGLLFTEFYEQRLGSRAAVQIRQEQVKEAALLVGLNINLERITLMPNTDKAHRFLKYAAKHGSSEQYESLLERLFSAYFILGEDIGNEETLLNIAQSYGFNRAELKSWLAAPEASLAESLRPLVHAGVPYFVFNRRHAIAGAHPPGTLVSVMLNLIAEELVHDTSIPAG